MASKKILVSAAVGTAVAASLAAASLANAAGNPFEMQSLKNGYQVAAADKAKEGKCGGDKAAKADGEGKCGEGKCGEKKAEEAPKQ